MVVQISPYDPNLLACSAMAHSTMPSSGVWSLIRPLPQANDTITKTKNKNKTKNKKQNKKQKTKKNIK
jgi:hypothetical protein